MDIGSCRERFAAARVTHLASVRPDGTPHVVPVTTAVLLAHRAGDLSGEPPGPDVIAFAIDHKPKRTADLQRLHNIADHPRVAFLADVYDEDWSRLWWVRADAHATVVTGGDAWDETIDALARKYPQYRSRRPDGAVVMAEVLRWTGWSGGAPVTVPPSSPR